MKRKIPALILAIALLLPITAIGAAAIDPPYAIGNPYESVDWDSWEQYKTQLHCHTNMSDGVVPIDEQIETHYALGYDILCITDHMTTGVPWDETPRAVPTMRLVKGSRTKMLPAAPLTPERRAEILAGTDRGGRGMLEVTRGNELNGAVFSNNHLNGFFSDYGQGKLGVEHDWLIPVREVHKSGGLTVINHPGDVNKAYESDDPYNFLKDSKWPNKFAYLFLNYDSCVGMDINSGTDNKTKYDKLLYDMILAKTIPHGVVPWSFAYSDAHSPGEFDRAWTVHVMPEKTVGALRTSMEDGTFFGFSRYAPFEMGDSFAEGVGGPPKVERIAVDQDAGTITIEANHYNSIVWVTNGTVIVAEDVTTLDIAGYDDVIGTYVRAYLLGDGGILYVQPFTVLRAGELLCPEYIRDPFDFSVPLRWMVDGINFAFMPWVLPLKWGWKALTRFDPALDAPWLANLLQPLWRSLFE